MALACLAGLALAGCAGAEPTPEMTRSARLVLGKTVAGDQRLGECLDAAGYDTDQDKVAGDVERGADITFRGETERVYTVPVHGPETISFAVTYESGFVLAPADQDKARLKEIGCELDG